MSTSFALYTIQSSISYDQLRQPLLFNNHTHHLTNWIMRPPLTIFSADLKSKHVFSDGKVIVSENAKTYLDEKWKYFVITKQTGVRLYCTSQMFYVSLQQNQSKIQINNSRRVASQNMHQPSFFYASDEFYVPSCLVLISESPYFKLQVNLLKICRELRTANSNYRFCLQKGLEGNACSCVKDSTGSINVFECIHFWKDSSNILNYFLNACNRHLVGEAIYYEKEISLPLLHVYKLKAHNPFELNYFFNLPLSPLTLRIIFSAILQQKQLIFTSNNQNLNVMVIESVMQMMCPLKWCHMYVPNLPCEMISAAVENFMPYIIGLQKKHLHLMETQQKVIIDIDSNEVSGACLETILDSHYDTYFTYSSKSHLDYLSWEIQIRSKSLLFIAQIISPLLHPSKSTFIHKFQPTPIFQHSFAQSTMFQMFKQDFAQGLHQEFFQFIMLPTEKQKKQYLHANFSEVQKKALHPTLINNEQSLSRYYFEHSASYQKTIDQNEAEKANLNKRSSLKSDRKLPVD